MSRKNETPRRLFSITLSEDVVAYVKLYAKKSCLPMSRIVEDCIKAFFGDDLQSYSAAFKDLMATPIKPKEQNLQDNNPATKEEN